MAESIAAVPAASPARRERYQVLETIGRGASATVLKVLDQELEEVVALKVLAPELARDPAVLDRLKSEIRIARRVRHPNVARVYDLEQWDSRLCISMEYIEGETLARRIERGPLPWQETLPLLATLALALGSAHELEVVHRDLKPANVILDRLGRPYVLDFGIALAPGSDAQPDDVIHGSPIYMAPERWRGVPGLPASDFYSLGVLSFQMLTGKVPFQGSSVRVLMSQHIHASIPRPSATVPDVPAALDDLVVQLLAKRPEDRPHPPPALARALRRLIPKSGGMARPLRGKVLVIDDDTAVRRLLAELLRRRGVNVIEAAGGEEGLACALSDRPDLVLLDIGMPGIDGVDTLKVLKTNPALAGRPVVMLTGSLDPEHPALARGLGAAAYLNKPVNGDVLDLILDKYLG